MYDISVPIKIAPTTRFGITETIAELNKLDTKRVIIALGFYELDPEKKAASLQDLKDVCDALHQQGFEVGAWVWTFMFQGAHPYTTMRSINGDPISS